VLSLIELYRLGASGCKLFFEGFSEIFFLAVAFTIEKTLSMHKAMKRFNAPIVVELFSVKFYKFSHNDYILLIK
jgi:hypothetical protein